MSELWTTVLDALAIVDLSPATAEGRDPLTWSDSPTRTSYGLSKLSDCDRHADSMIDCGSEGER